MSIPSKVHFIWLGNEIDYVYYLSILSAKLNSGCDEIIFHHEKGLKKSKNWHYFNNLDGLVTREINLDVIFNVFNNLKSLYIELYHNLKKASAKANILRLAILYNEGGVYLDTDIIVLKNFKYLFSDDFFCGREYVIFPGSITYKMNLFQKIYKKILSLFRDRYSRINNGWHKMKKINPLLSKEVNNAVLGSIPNHPLIKKMMEVIIEKVNSNNDDYLRNFALGTHLLQESIVDNNINIKVYEPEYFYPLGPVIANQLFLLDIKKIDSKRILTDKTLMIHWYSSHNNLHLLPQINDDYIMKNKEGQFFSQIVYKYILNKKGTDHV